jgi:hypothetical protein
MNNTSTDHYLLRKPWDYYRPSKTTRESQNLELSILPLYCSSTVDTLCFNKTLGEKPTIYNKRRDKFSINVGKGLTLTDITIDSLDSILDQEND